MRTLLKMTYILPMLFIGLIIGGAVAGDKPAWVSGLVLLLLDIVVGIALQYYYGGGNVNPVTFLRKARKFKKNPYLVQRFSIAQMSAGMKISPKPRASCQGVSITSSAHCTSSCRQRRK